jgi:hypothetical protein
MPTRRPASSRNQYVVFATYPAGRFLPCDLSFEVVLDAEIAVEHLGDVAEAVLANADFTKEFNESWWSLQ